MGTNGAPVPTHVTVHLGPAGALPWSIHTAWRVVHVGQSAVVLSGPGDGSDDLFVVTTGARGLVPGGASLPVRADFDALRALARRDGTLDLTGWDAATAVHPVDLRLGTVAVDRRAVDAMLAGLAMDETAGVLMDPRPLRALAPALAHAVLAFDDAASAGVAAQLIGAGPGATPAGDDVVVGVAAGLLACGAVDAAATLRAAVRPLLERTARASRHDLRAALAGEFSEHAHLLVGALRHPGLVAAALRRARAWGATSGFDLAAGVAWSTAAASGTRGGAGAGASPEPVPSHARERRCA